MSLEQHNPEQVAHLIYESSPKLFSLMFGSHGIQNLTQLVQGSENPFSYQYVRVAQIAEQVVGIALMMMGYGGESDQWDYPIQQFRVYRKGLERD